MPITFVVTDASPDPQPLGCDDYLTVTPAQATFDYILSSSITALPVTINLIDQASLPKVGHTFDLILDSSGDGIVDSLNDLEISEHFTFCHS